VGLGRQLSVKADAEELDGVFCLDQFPVDHNGHVARVVISLAQLAASLAELATYLAGSAESVAKLVSLV
jgi:hypothetical protein